MASSSENISMAVFCDFENVALGVRDANYDKFDIKPVLERLLLKGSIVVKKAYCDWDRYKSFKGTMHEANFELIEIPHVRQSGKNSADIRMVVDALDLCYTKAHVDTFVIISGDSDFSPLVSKLRENAKRVIGVGVKNSTSDLLVANCDEFIFYDDLVREQRRAAAKRDERKAQPQSQSSQNNRRPSDESNRKREEMETRKLQAIEMVVETFDALVAERGDTGKIWASLLKDTLKRRRPDFNETYFGFRTFGNLLEDAQTRGLFEFGRDEKSGTYVFRNPNLQLELPAAEPLAADVEQPQAVAEQTSSDAGDAAGDVAAAEPAEQAPREPRGRGRGGRGRKGREQGVDGAQAKSQAAQRDGAATELGAETAGEADTAPAAATIDAGPAPTPDLAEQEPLAAAEPVTRVDADVAQAATETEAAPAAAKERRRAPRAPRKTAARKGAAEAVVPVEEGAVSAETSADTPADIPAAAAPAPVASANPSEDDTAVAGDAADIDADGAKAERKKGTRPAHKAPSRTAAPRARRPAKPKTPPENS
jgi:uncharacterized protein (TIGR00288 family)